MYSSVFFAASGLFISGGVLAEEIAIIKVETAHPAARFVPSEALGAGLDGHQKGDTARIYRPESIKELASIPFYRVSYRLRTELGAAVWHWNEEGAWSDPKHTQGYWTSSDKASAPLSATYGYRLPRRGNTLDQANHDGYSRLDDGNEASFWKSNPYLDAHFTGHDDTGHPQWVIINFERKVEVNALRILWGEPFATDYDVAYWDGKPVEFYKDMLDGHWRTFPKGRVQNGAGGAVSLTFGAEPVHTQLIRIVLRKSSETAPSGSGDIRDRLGFAVRELYAGRIEKDGRFTDLMTHAPDGTKQTKIVTSSTDPWHRATDRDNKIEQPGIDLVMKSGLTRGRPVMMPTGLLYDTPENVAAEIRYLKARGYEVRQIELGEEPDGQYVSPEHYGALFIQFADAIRRENPALVLGGPGFQSEIDGWNAIPDDAGRTSWMGRFLAFLKTKNRSTDFGFFSFEWYPFDDLCKETPSQQLIEHPKLIRDTAERLAQDGVSRQIPWIITEYGYSSFAGQREVELPAALLNAEIVAEWLLTGVKTAYLYGIEPNVPIKEVDACETWGNLMALEEGSDGSVKWRLPTYYGAKLLMEDWLGAPDGLHSLYRASVPDRSLAAYAVRRPDGSWATLILNKDSDRTRAAEIRPGDPKGAEWSGPRTVIQYSSKQYAWQANGAEGHPAFSNPPARFPLAKDAPLVIDLPPMSITVVREEASRPTADDRN